MIYLVELILYIIISYKYRHNKTVLVLLLLQMLSALAVVIIGSEEFNTIEVSIFVPIIVFFNLLLIIPWRNYDSIYEIYCPNLSKLKRVSNIFLALSAFSFVVLSVVALIVLLFVDDINTFKYVDGSSDFYLKMLPFNIRFYYLARLFYHFSFFLIPLHFYYLSIGNKRYSILCLLLSFNIIIYGIAFFSRWTIVLFGLEVLFYFIIFRRVMPQNVFKIESKLFFIIGLLFVGVFAVITLSRFNSGDKLSSNYEAKIPIDSRIQDPSLYSICDYLGQSNYQGAELLKIYDGRTFGGRVLFSGINDLLYAIGVTHTKDLDEIKEKLWPDNMVNGFTGFAAYTVYDIGYMGTIIFCILYYKLVRIRNRRISIQKLLLSAALIQMPICSIFYSQAGMAAYGLFLVSPFFFYLKK